MASSLPSTPPPHLPDNNTTTTFTNLSPEILLDIISHVPYTPPNILHLRLTSPSLNTLITTHEHSLVTKIKHQHFPPTTPLWFPGLPQKNTSRGLRSLYTRLQTLDEMHKSWLVIVNHGPDLHWLRGRWEDIHSAGLLLLYRLQDAGEYEHKVELMTRLPATSLACLLFKLISSVKILRVYGPEPIRGSCGSGDVMARNDIELAFEELLLQHGPDFFIVMLKQDQTQPSKLADTVRKLETEVSGMEARQQPLPNGRPKPPTLISCLRRAFAKQVGCEVCEAVGGMWDVGCVGLGGV